LKLYEGYNRNKTPLEKPEGEIFESLIEEACLKFDLTAKDEEFLIHIRFLKQFNY